MPGRSNQNLSEIKFPDTACLPPKVTTEPKTGIEAASSIGRYVIVQIKGKRPHSTDLILMAARTTVYLHAPLSGSWLVGTPAVSDFLFHNFMRI